MTKRKDLVARLYYDNGILKQKLKDVERKLKLILKYMKVK